MKLVQMLNWSMYTHFFKKIIISDGYGQSFQLGHVVGLICACTKSLDGTSRKRGILTFGMVASL